MTLQRYWTGSVDAQNLEEAPGLPCRVLVTGAEHFASPYSGTTMRAAEGTPHIQYLYAPEIGIAFSITLEFCPNALHAALLALLAAHIAADTNFRVILTDGIQTIDTHAKCLMPDWYGRGEPSGAYIQNVTFSFITTGD